MKQSQNPVWNVSLVKYVMSSALRRECQQPSVCLHLSRVTTGLDYTTNEYILVLCNTYSYFYLSQVTPHVSEPLCEPCSVWPNVVSGPKKIRNFSSKKNAPLDVSKCRRDTNNLPDLPKFKTVSFRRKWKGQLILPKVQIWLPYYPNSSMSEMWVL